MHFTSSPTAPATGDPNAHLFTALTYNILARSLGSNTIPWVMQVSPDTKRRVEGVAGLPWDEWRRGAVDAEYKRHWHKNFASGDYATMRKFWSCRRLQSADAIPGELPGLAFESEDRVRYGDRVATTLRGALRASLGEDEGLRLFEEVRSSEETVYDWESARGPRVFAEAIRGDVVALQEYDVHGVAAAYDGAAVATFAAAMRSKGFAGVFAKDPLAGRDPPSGLGLFWRSSVFEALGGGGDVELECGEAAGGAANYDLEERWRPLSDGGGDAALPPADRRNCVVARLRHRASGRVVCVVAAHLMTTSRDGPRVTKHPGEVRAGELARIKTIVEAAVEPGDALVFMGDFNTPPSDARVFEGRVGDGFDTGFADGGFAWAGRTLRCAFEADWADESKCTSRNGDRKMWIDYLYHDRTLGAVGRSDATAPPRAIPDEARPSDHLPLAATFKFVE